MKPHSRLLFLAMLALTPVLVSSCAIYRNDRCFVPEEQYLTARDMFTRSGSLDIVERQLNAFEWRRCRVNEILYRLSKEFEVLPEEIIVTPTATPAPVATPVPTATPATQR